MQLKNYQRNTLEVLRAFFENCRLMDAAAAFKKVTEDPDIALRLGKLKSPYVAWDAIPRTPRVCLKVPTGGGKTIIAAHTVKLAGDAWCEKTYPLALWFVPSDIIRRQTTEALKNPRHPYREVLDDQFGGKVAVFDLDEKFTIRPGDIRDNACIIVSTIQSFVHLETDKYNVYKDNENLEDHFAQMAPGDFAGMEELQKGSRSGDRVKYSFANLLYHHRPIMIVDEAHKAVTDLTRETQKRINPAAIIEFTATPQANNNTLYSVRASELKGEEMIKLPIVLVEHRDWENAVTEAIARRAALEKDAATDRDYIRPLVLFQAQRKDQAVTADALRQHLIDNAGIKPSEIVTVTGEQKELDGVNVFDPKCPVRYVITVEALKEGWDCSFAYVLCSLANVHSDTSVEQLLGRVMRMPYARTRAASSLNKAYAFVVSPQFGDAAAALTEKLVKKGFDEGEAAASIQLDARGLSANWTTPLNVFTLTGPINKADIPGTIKVETREGMPALVFTAETSDGDIQRVCAQVGESAAYELKWKFNNFKKNTEILTPAKEGNKFALPRLLIRIDSGPALFADSGALFMQSDWDISQYAAPRLEADEFALEDAPGKGFFIDIDGNRLNYQLAGDAALSLPFAEVKDWTPELLVGWLDRELHQTDIAQYQLAEWLRKNIEYLSEVRGITLTRLMIAKYALKSKLLAKIDAARTKARREAFNLFTDTLQRDTGRTMIDFNRPFEFSDTMYDDLLFAPYRYGFQKHYLGPRKIPEIDGGESGEEFACAKALDENKDVSYWIRNVARHRSSFRLPTSTDNFYPDFAALLNDGRILVVEYKGAHLAETPDTKEKTLIGELWAKQTGGKGLFLVALKDKEGLSVAEQIRKKIAGT